MSDRAGKYETLHVDLTGPLEIQREKGHKCLLIMAHRVHRGTQGMLIPWVAPPRERQMHQRKAAG
eukprot:7659818-Prorocentrum_lima.AAC.1